MFRPSFLYPARSRNTGTSFAVWEGMSKHNNVNPNFYKTGGREHTDGSDKGDVHVEPKDQVAKAKKKVLPGAEPDEKGGDRKE